MPARLTRSDRGNRGGRDGSLPPFPRALRVEPAERRRCAAATLDRAVSIAAAAAVPGGRPAPAPPVPAAAHRADIDGLRAVAVIAVVLYHAGAPLVPGGFVGVDVFFVISGFLIARLVDTECRAGCFSFAGFCERRIRRLLPALTAVLAASTIAALLLLPAPQLEQYARSLLSANVLGANVFFWRTSGYFSGAAELQPLLHTWSLAVEEQFYLAFPLLLALTRRCGRGAAVGAIATVALVSFAASVWGATHRPGATFYLLPTRAWELMLGALLALAPLPGLRMPIRRSAVALCGFVLIGWAALAYSGGTRFPGAAALLPCVGTALVVYAGGCGDHPLARLLAVKPLVVIGLASYSLYLWHWPLLVFARHATATSELSPALSFAVLAVSLVAAIASWRFVERPFRRVR